MSDIIPLADQPRVLYLYEGENGQLMVFAVKQDLAAVLNFTVTRPPLLAPQTPEPVRRMLYRKQFQTRDKKPFLTKMLLHTTPSGLCFFEVHLTSHGVSYLRAKNSGGHMNPATFNVFEAYGERPTAAGEKPTPRLEEALSYLGYTPL